MMGIKARYVERSSWEVLSAVRSIAIASVFVAFLSSAAAAVPLGSLNQLTNINVFSSEEEVKVRLYFRKSANFSKLRKFTTNNSIFIDVPKSYVHPAHQTVRVEDSLLSSIELYQFTEDEVRVRLLLAKAPKELKEPYSVSVEEDNLAIFIKKGKDSLQRDTISEIDEAAGQAKPKPEAQEALNRAKQVSEKVEPVQVERTSEPLKESADEILASVIINNPDRGAIKESAFSDLLYEPLALKKDIADKVLSVEAPSSPLPLGKVAQNELTSSGLPDLFSASFKIAIASAIILAALIASAFAAKKWASGRRAWAGKDKLIKILSTSHIGPKKMIVLVQIGGEELVLGIAGDSITLLAKLENSANPNGFDNHLDRAESLSRRVQGLDELGAEEGDGNGEVEQSVAILANSIRDRISRLKKI